MKYMRQAISAITVLALCVYLCACSQNSGETDIFQSGENSNTGQNISTALPAAITPDIEDDKKYITTEIIDISSATSIDFRQNNAQISGIGATAQPGLVTITSAGSYVLSGSFEGQIRIAASSADKVTLILNNFSGTNSYDSVIYTESADKVIIKTQDGTSNIINDTDTTAESETDTRGKAAIYGKTPLEFSGSGTLEISSAYKHAVATTKKLTVSNGTLNVSAVGAGLKGNNSVVITGGAVYISSNGDGIKTEETEDTEKGFVNISGGKITVNTQGDAIRATISCDISGGTINIVTTGADSAITSDNIGKGMGERSNRFMGEPNSNFTGERPDKIMEEQPNKMPEGRGGKAMLGEDTQSAATPNTAPPMPSASDYTPGNAPNYTPKTAPDNIPDNAPDNAPGQAPETMPETASETDNSNDASSKGIKVGCETVGTAAQLNISGGTINIDSTGHGVHCTGSITIDGAANLTISSDQKGIQAHDMLYIKEGTVNILTSTEGMESKNDMEISGGKIKIYATDDGLNVGNSGKTLYISGGFIDVTTSAGDTDGIDSNGSLDVSGGLVIVKGGSSQGRMAGSIDVNGKVYVNGGTVAAFGGICELPDTSSAACTVVMNGTNFAAGSYTVNDSYGNEVFSFTLDCDYRSAWISSESFTLGETYYISKDGASLISWTQVSKICQQNM